MKARMSRKFFCLLLTVVMVCTLLPIAALAAGSSGSIESVVITHDNGVLKNAVSVELKDVTFAESVAVKLYSGDTLLTTATLQGVTPGSYGFLTCCIATETADANWALTPWTPRDNVVPDTAVLFVDGQEQDTKIFTLDADEWAVLPGTYGGSIESVVITHDNKVLKNAVSVELQNVNFASSVQVQLYSDETLLTTAMLNTDKLRAGSYSYLTCCIATETADEYWALTPWTPKDDVVPNKAVLVVDGLKLAEKTFELNADEWAALPGTALPSSGSINGAVITQNAVSVELENITFAESVAVKLYSGDTLLTTATLKTGILNVGQNYLFVTCCIPTKGEDGAWSLTRWTPKDDVVPNKAVLFVDGRKLDEKTFTLNAEDWANLPGTAFPYSGSIERAAITHDNGTLKNAVSVDLKNVNFESSVQVQLYSGKTLLTTATLNTDKLGAGSYPYLTCCIATETADANWALTPWTPKDDVVPNKVVLFVDDNKMDTMEFTLNAEDWANLPGTVLPYSGSIGGGVTTYSITVKSAKNGDVTASHKTASKGTTVTLTVDPDKGYVLDTLTVLDGKDKEIKLTEKNGKYTFTMPAGKVTVEAMFKTEQSTGKNPFIDVPAGSYYEDAVIWAVDKGITTGTGNGRFSPDAPCTRAQIVTFLWRAAGSPAPKSMSSFSDVPAEAFYAKAVAWAVEKGITSGTGDGKFSPDATCTRAQAVTFLYRANGSPAVSGNSAFTDVAADAYYAAAVKWAEKNGITGGIGGGLFGSDNDCTRSQIVTFLWRCKK